MKRFCYSLFPQNIPDTTSLCSQQFGHEAAMAWRSAVAPVSGTVKSVRTGLPITKIGILATKHNPTIYRTDYGALRIQTARPSDAWKSFVHTSADPCQSVVDLTCGELVRIRLWILEEDLGPGGAYVRLCDADDRGSKGDPLARVKSAGLVYVELFYPPEWRTHVVKGKELLGGKTLVGCGKSTSIVRMYSWDDDEVDLM